MPLTEERSPVRICYVLLSPTFGMHQYTADLANRLAEAGHQVHLVTTAHLPRDRYGPAVAVHTPIQTGDTGLSLQALQPAAIRRVLDTIRRLAPDAVHFTGPHLWNALLIQALTARHTPTAHTLHDLHPHAGAGYGRLLYLWNGWVRRRADHLLVHGERYAQELTAHGLARSQVTCTLLTHLFVSHARQQSLARSAVSVQYEPFVLFLGRLERYKGLGVLLEAAQRLGPTASDGPAVVIAGHGPLENLDHRQIPPHVQLRHHLIGDEEAVELFSRCSLLVLPYIEASQSALVAAAYFFRKPVVVTDVGALPEYVVEGETGWVIPANDPQALADTLQAALRDPARLERMGMAGRRWYEQQREAEGIALREMYAKLTAGNRRAA